MHLLSSYPSRTYALWCNSDWQSLPPCSLCVGIQLCEPSQPFPFSCFCCIATQHVWQMQQWSVAGCDISQGHRWGKSSRRLPKDLGHCLHQRSAWEQGSKTLQVHRNWQGQQLCTNGHARIQVGHSLDIFFPWLSAPLATKCCWQRLYSGLFPFTQTSNKCVQGMGTSMLCFDAKLMLASFCVGLHHMFCCIAMHMCTLTVYNQQLATRFCSKRTSWDASLCIA